MYLISSLAQSSFPLGNTFLSSSLYCFIFWHTHSSHFPVYFIMLTWWNCRIMLEGTSLSRGLKSKTLLKENRAKLKAVPGSQGIVWVSFEYSQGYFYSLCFSAAAPSQERISPHPFTVLLWSSLILSLFVNPYQIVEDGLNKPSVLRPFLFAACSETSALLVAACWACLSLTLSRTGGSPKQHLWDCRKTQYRVLEKDNFCLPFSMLLVMWPSTQWVFTVSRAHCWCLLSIRHLSPKLFSSLCCCSGLSCCMSTIWHVVFFELWEVQHSSSSSTSCPWILLW